MAWPRTSASSALDRSEILLPYLKEGVSLARIAQEQKQIQRLPNRWAAEYRRLRMRGRCFKLNAHKDKRRTLPTIQQLSWKACGAEATSADPNSDRGRL